MTRALLGLLVAGAAIRLALVAAIAGDETDLESMRIVAEVLRGDQPLEVYSTRRWPYPPGYFAALVPLDALADATGIGVKRLVRLPLIAADLTLAALVHRHLLAAGRPRDALRGAALVALGPPFIYVSSVHGQLETLAMLPAAAGLLLWMRREPGSLRTALAVGLLIGIGAALKSIPILLLLAVLPTARSWREAAAVVVPAGALPLLLMAPFLAADLQEALRFVRYHGIPGQGGVSLLVQPGLADITNVGREVEPSAATHWLTDHGWAITLAGVTATAVRMRVLRAEPLTAAVAAVLAVYVFGLNFFVYYGVWLLPFLLLGGRLRAALVYQAALIVPILLVHSRPLEEQWMSTAYVVSLLVLLAAFVVWHARLMRHGR